MQLYLGLENGCFVLKLIHMQVCCNMDINENPPTHSHTHSLTHVLTHSLIHSLKVLRGKYLNQISDSECTGRERIFFNPCTTVTSVTYIH